jgi:hypothetical protein
MEHIVESGINLSQSLFSERRMNRLKFSPINVWKRRKAMVMDKNSLCYWFPLLEKYQDRINYPQTIIYPLDHLNPLDLIENQDAIKSFQTNDLPKIEMIFKILGFPLFLKTDEFSGKHSWEKTCFIPNKTSFLPNLARLIEESFCVDMCGLPLNALIFRKFIPLHSPFNFFHGNMPVARERRYFIKNGQIQCNHAYWDQLVFEDVFASEDKMFESLTKMGIKHPYSKKFSSEKRDQIRQWVREINTETPDEAILMEYCKTIIPSFPEFWSVDFAYGKDRKWYLIDMALGDVSWHPKCIHENKK